MNILNESETSGFIDTVEVNTLEGFTLYVYLYFHL
jgi:hypothetical protein